MDVNDIDINFEYEAPDGSKIPQVDNTKDLGVFISSDIKFKDHIKFVHSKCRQLMGWALRTFKTRKADLMLTLWKSLIIPRLDYCSQLYFPTAVNEMQQLEALQRTFTSHISSITNLDYWQRLKQFKLYSVERRFERYLLIYSWKIIEDKIIPPEPFSVSDLESRTGRKFIIHANDNLNLPFNRAKSSFNALPKKIRNCTNVNFETFKKHLDKYHLYKVPDEPNVSGYKKYRCATTNTIKEQSRYIYGGE